jgi:hypothetical protein
MADSSYMTQGPAGYAPSGQLAEYRLPPRYVRPNRTQFITLGAVTVLLAFAWERGHEVSLVYLALISGVFAVYHGAAYIWRGRFRTRLTSEGVEICGYFNHFVPWRDVQGFEVGGYGDSRPLNAGYDVRVAVAGRGSYRRSPGRIANTGRRARLGTVHLVRTSGRRMLLRAPLVTGWAPDPYFDQKARQLQELGGQYGTRPMAGQAHQPETGIGESG